MWAHSFLVTTSPTQGERVTGSPDAIVLEFSERPDPGTAVVELRTSAGEILDVPSPQIPSDGVSMTVPVPDELDDGIYVVSWQALSAVDGHGTFGEFSFGVGDIAESIPAPVESSSGSMRETIASWAFVVGLALAAGPLVVGLLERRPPSRRPVRVGLVFALGGVALLWIDIIGRGSSEGVLAPAAALALIALTMSAHAVTRHPVPPLVLLAGGAAAWAASSHVTASEGTIGWFVDVIHLLAGAAWAGALATVVARMWRGHRRGEAWMAVVRPYARFALALVVVLAAAGIVSALAVLPTWNDLWDTRYGQLLGVKVALFIVALGLAATSRWALAGGRAGVVRRVTTAEISVLVVVLALAGVLANITPPAPAVAAEALLGPPPLNEPVTRNAGLAGNLNVAVASDGSRLEIRILSPSGPVPDAAVAVSIQQPEGSTADVIPRPCGPGCFTQHLDLAEGTTAVSVDAKAPGWTGGRYEGDLEWPLGPRAADRLREVIEITRAIPELTVAWTTRSGAGASSGEDMYQMSGEEFIDVEPYAAGNVEDVHRLSSSPERLAFYVPGSKIYAEVTLDDLGRMTESRLVNPGHEHHRRFSYPEE